MGIGFCVGDLLMLQKLFLPQPYAILPYLLSERKLINDTLNGGVVPHFDEAVGLRTFDIFQAP